MIVNFLIPNEAQTHVSQKVPVDDFISGSLVSALLFVRCSDISRQQRVKTASKSQSDSKCDPASATAQSRLARVRCGAELAGRVKCGLEQARASQD